MTEFKIEVKILMTILLTEKEFENFEVDYEDENLVIQTCSGEKTFIISIHEPTSQIYHRL